MAGRDPVVDGEEPTASGVRPGEESSSAATASLEAQLGQILAEHGPWLRRVIDSHCPRALGIDPQDIEQEVSIRLWRALERETNIASLPSYLRRVIKTATIDAVRRAKARGDDQKVALAEPGDPQETGPSMLPEDPRPDPEERTRQAQLFQHVEELLAELPAARRRAVALYLRGFSNREVANLAEWSEAKARNLIYRGLAMLRQKMKERLSDDDDG